MCKLGRIPNYEGIFNYIDTKLFCRIKLGYIQTFVQLSRFVKKCIKHDFGQEMFTIRSRCLKLGPTRNKELFFKPLLITLSFAQALAMELRLVFRSVGQISRKKCDFKMLRKYRALKSGHRCTKVGISVLSSKFIRISSNFKSTKFFF